MGEMNVVLAVFVVLFCLLLVGCFESRLEAYTSAPVEIFSKPAFAETPGNQQIGVLPSNVTIDIRRQVIRKELVAYEIEYVSPEGDQVIGYVLLSSPGLEVKERR